MAKVLIIGAGVSGLSAGIYARLAGHEAVVCDRQATAGGNLTGWKRGEYEIDNCIHWLTGTNPNSGAYRIWKDLGALGDVEIHQGERLYTVEKNGKTLSLWRDLSKMEREMLALSPVDEREIRRLIKAIQLVQTLSGCGVAKNGLPRKATAKDYLAAPSLLRYHQISTGELADKFRHSAIKALITAVTDKPFSAFAFVATAATFCSGNGGVPQGGSRKTAERIAERFRRLGGRLRLSCGVKKIDCEEKRAVKATYENGDEEWFDDLIITADPTCVFGKILPVEMPKALAKRYSDPKMIRFSSFHFAYACNVSALPFRGDYIFYLPSSARKILKSDRLILREFSHEKTFAPTGKTVLQTLVFCKEKECRSFIRLRKDKTAYQAKKKELERCVQEQIASKFPALAEGLTLLDGWTPATYERYTGSETGSYMSFILPPKQNPLPISCRVKGLENVFLATQWQQLPGGLPTAAKLGKTAAETVIKKERAAGAIKAKKKIPLFR